MSSIININMKKARKKIIIVGGGTAGSIISKNLSGDFGVSLFEQSANKDYPYANRIPLLIGLLYKKANRFITKIDVEFNIGRTVPFFVSNVLGGASVMNGCVHVVGSGAKWRRLLHRFNLTSLALEESYRKLFSKTGEKNKISIKQAKKSELDDIFFAAMGERGVPIGDVEWMDSCESGSIYNTINRIFRSSVKDLSPYKNISLSIGHRVENLVVDDSMNVIGVYAKEKYFLADYVILSCGVIGTNALLNRPAIRFSDRSPVNLGLNSGLNIQDHTNLRINVLASRKINSLNEIAPSLTSKVLLALKHLLGAKTLMMGTGATSAAHLDIDGDGVVDTRIQILNFSESGRIGSDGELFSSSQPGFSVSITVLNPKSYGQIIFDGNNTIVKPNYLSNEYDIEHLQKTLLFVVDVLESSPFKSIVDSIDKVQHIKDQPREYILSNAYSGYHLIGGCSHLIGENFELKNHKNLYICDASVMDEHVSSNIHAAVAILADMFSKEFITYCKI